MGTVLATDCFAPLRKGWVGINLNEVQYGLHWMMACYVDEYANIVKKYEKCHFRPANFAPAQCFG